jgi:hypothetical protein
MSDNLIIDPNDIDFRDGDIGNWVVVKNGTGTIVYNTTDIGGTDNKQALLTSSGGDGYLYGELSSSRISISANTLLYLQASVYVPASNTLKKSRFRIGNFDAGNFYNVGEITLIANTWTIMSAFYQIDADTVGVIRVGFGGNPENDDKLYFDNVIVTTSGVKNSIGMGMGMSMRI